MTGNRWLDLAVAFILFLASQQLPRPPRRRQRMVAALGEVGYLLLYSTVSLLALIWLIVASGRAPYVEVWAFAPRQLWVPSLAMPVCCLLVAFGIRSLPLQAAAGCRPASTSIPRSSCASSAALLST